jgi:hypothetical protein
MTCTKIVTPTGTGMLCSETENRRPDPDCPNAGQHTPHPDGYNRHAEWAEQMLKTHRQQRCEGCGNLSIWVPKGQGEMTTGSKPGEPS